MKFSYYTRKIAVLVILMSSFWTHLEAQNIPQNASIENIDKLSDDQLYEYYQQIKAQGYTIEQVKVLAKARGVSSAKIREFEDRVNSYEQSDEENSESDANLLEISDNVTDDVKKPSKKENSPIFGKDFFANESISFSPNSNLSTPDNYILGPGDELVISIWGAAERSYNVSVDREGAVRIPNIGPIYVNGLSINEAKERIKSSLQKIYNGLNAPASSPYRINLGVSLSSVRTVQVNIIGQVETPGTYSLSSLSTVLNAIYAAGGPTDQGTFRDVKLVRNGEEPISFDIYGYLTKGSQEGNITLRDQDVIIVSPYLSRVKITGQVKREGIFELKPEETLSDLLKYTSGFKSNAYKEIVVLERIANDRKKVVEINTENSSQEILKDGDVIVVKETIDKFSNKVAIEGAVYRPGTYEFVEGLTVAQLINKAAGVLEQAYLDRASILRTEDGVSVEVVSFSLNEAINENTTSIVLQRDDVVRVFNKYDLEKTAFITITGAVNQPKRIRFIDNLTVEDLVLLAGGFSKNADPTKIDIYRSIDGEREDQIVETIRINSNGTVDNSSESSFILEPNDQISVRYLKGYSNRVTASIKGEVGYPGSYGLETREERISDLIIKSGGLNKFAFPDGASLSRLNPYYVDKAQISVANTVKENISNLDENIKLNNPPSLTVGIDLVKIMKNPGGKNDLILKDGDVIVVPSIKQTVKVEGEILAPSLVRFDKSYDLKDYISNSGGFAENARKSKTYVVYLNGEIAATKSFLFFKSYPKLKPGALIIVPNKPERPNRLEAQEIAGLATGLATLTLLFVNIFSN